MIDKKDIPFATLRQCQSCNYQSVFLRDYKDLKKKCTKCGGIMEIIMQEDLKDV